MTYKLHFKLLPTCTVLLLLPLLIGLGYWQWRRADYKQYLYDKWQENSAITISLNDLSKIEDPLFQRIKVSGHLDNERSFLLDNRVYQGQAGYHVITPLKIANEKRVLLIDRGWIAMGRDRNQLPELKPISKQLELIGSWYQPAEKVFSLSDQLIETNRWPYRIQFININQLASILNQELYPFILILEPNQTAGFAFDKPLPYLSPERHRGYAFQWWSLAITLIILFLWVSLKKKSNNEETTQS